MVGPDKEGKKDNHANEVFAYEGQELRDFLSAQSSTYVICGDRHWQYVSVHDETGLREYASGAASDAHANAWIQGDVRPEHRYLNVVGGFLSVTVDRQGATPTMLLRHHGVDGQVLNEDMLVAE